MSRHTLRIEFEQIKVESGGGWGGLPAGTSWVQGRPRYFVDDLEVHKDYFDLVRELVEQETK